MTKVLGMTEDEAKKELQRIKEENKRVDTVNVDDFGIGGTE